MVAVHIATSENTGSRIFMVNILLRTSLLLDTYWIQDDHRDKQPHQSISTGLFWGRLVVKLRRVCYSLWAFSPLSLSPALPW